MMNQNLISKLKRYVQTPSDEVRIRLKGVSHVLLKRYFCYPLLSYNIGLHTYQVNILLPENTFIWDEVSKLSLACANFLAYDSLENFGLRFLYTFIYHRNIFVSSKKCNSGS